MILAGYIGGTSTRLALLDVIDGRLKPIVEQKYSSREHQNLDDIVRLFITQHRQPVDRACFGIAGGRRPSSGMFGEGASDLVEPIGPVLFQKLRS
jgi:glucokinase